MRERYDVVVVGGGPGGTCAAVVAAKEGASVLLIEAHSSLRVMPVVAGIGEAAGVAAAWAALEGVSPRQVDGARLKAAMLGE